MTGIPISQSKNQEPSKPPVRVTNKDEKVFEKKEHQLIYRDFLDTLKNQEKYTQQKINNIINLNKKKLSNEKEQELKERLESLNKRLKQLQNFSFILNHSKIIFNSIDQEKIKPLSEENFCEFLLGVLKEVREKKLAGEEDSKVKEVVEGCLDDIRGTEAKDSLIKLIGLPFGIKIDPKNISGSFLSGLKEKIPFLGGDKKEEDEALLSDEEMVTKFLRKVFLPVLFSIASILIFGPTTLAIVAAVIGTIFAVKGGVEVLFSNNKKGTLYDPSSQDKDDTEKRAKLNEKICNGIDGILKTKVKEIPEQISQGNGENKQYFASERICSPRKETPATLKQPTLDQPAKSTGQQTDLPNM